MAASDSHLIAAVVMNADRTTARHPKASQRALASDALRRASAGIDGAHAALTSISHTRGLALAVSMSTRQDASGGLGCDVEYAAPSRRWREIGVFLTDESFTGDADRSCQVWTLAEAWFKAFQVWPDKSLMRRAIDLDTQSEEEPIELAPAVHWFRFVPAPQFHASIVWRGNRVSPVVLPSVCADASSE